MQREKFASFIGGTRSVNVRLEIVN